jgi:hypothetical protein
MGADLAMDKALRSIRMGLGLLTAGLMLSGCAGLTKTRADYRKMHTEQQERDNYSTCVDQGAMPGSPENLACQLDLARKAQQAAKAQNPPAKSP